MDIAHHFDDVFFDSVFEMGFPIYILVNPFQHICIIVNQAQVNFVFDKLLPFHHQRPDIEGKHFYRPLEGLFDHVCIVYILHCLYYFLLQPRLQQGRTDLALGETVKCSAFDDLKLIGIMGARILKLFLILIGEMLSVSFVNAGLFLEICAGGVAG